MKRLMTTTLVVGALLVAGQAFAQTAPPTAPPKPQAPPTTPPAMATPQTPAKPVMAPFIEGSKIAVINFQYVANESIIGKAATKAINDLQDKKGLEVQEKNKQLQALTDKLKNASLLTDAVAKQTQQDADKLQLDIQYLTQTAQKEITDLQNNLMESFSEKVMPIIESLAKEKGVQLLFGAGAQSPVVYAADGLDLSAEVVKRVDAKFPK